MSRTDIHVLRERCRNFASEMRACAVFLVGHRGGGIAAVLVQPSESAAARELGLLKQLLSRPAFIARVHGNGEHTEVAPANGFASYAVAVSNRAVFALAFEDAEGVTEDVRVACKNEAEHLAELLDDLKGSSGGGPFGGGGGGGPDGDDARMWIGVEETRRDPD